jgi:hypothetical protein
MAIFKKKLGFWGSAALLVMSGRRDWCSVGRHGGQSVQAPFPFQAVTLHDGDRTCRPVGKSRIRSRLPTEVGAACPLEV